MKPTKNIILRGGSVFHPESLIIQDALLLYSKGTLFSPLKYSVSIPLDQVSSVESTDNIGKITIKTKHLSLTCSKFSQKKLRKLTDLIEKKYT